MTTTPEVIYLLDEIRAGVRSMDAEVEDSVDQIPALRQIVRASVEALSQLETRKDHWILNTLEMFGQTTGMNGYAHDYERSQEVEDRS